MTGPILLVDDNADFRRMTAELLTSAGYQVLPLEGGKEALAALHKHPISLILTDLYMPGITGLGLLRHLREIGRPVPPVIVMTGYAFLSNEEGRTAALALGAKVILTKPIDPKELLKAVAYTLTDGPKADVMTDDREREA